MPEDINAQLAVLIAAMRRVEEQLGQQNGHLRLDRERIARLEVAVAELCKDFTEARVERVSLAQRVGLLEITSGKLALIVFGGGLGGGGVVAAAVVLLRYLTTGQVSP